MTLEWFSNDCEKTNTKLITLTNYKGENNAMNQSEFLAILLITCTKLRKHCMIGFGFASPWLKN